ncbi:helix-turn-helix domain-containing protein [Paenibacillus cremeus]|uniref:Helix-turn-helix domain-containing protein n=1 Tax=Paenibacillus cremeus TaxID=2163881 RepID=A0A559KEN7_9BACL|nr:helix-turn-helix domain-containing protein [Paenibacillus cremeus]TVY10590.1 helix-turn-helix domain-containing protein [Paenibacillus cremeus]
MSELGLLLRKARMERKISLDDLQETTKIRKRYLEAIEDGNYKVLPGNFYVRAFIKSYSEAVGLDPNEVLRLYQNVIPAPEPEQIEPIRSKRTTRNTERFGKWASNVMMISFVVLILGIIYYYLNLNYAGGANNSVKDQPKKLTDKIEPAAQAPVASGGTTPAALADKKPDPVPTPTPAPITEVKLVKSERGTDYYTVSNAKSLKIEMKISGDSCWIELDSLGDKREMVEQGTYMNGNGKTWELTNAAYMIFGKANAAELSINGTPVVVGDAPNVKKLQIEFAK